MNRRIPIVLAALAVLGGIAAVATPAEAIYFCDMYGCW